MNIASSPSFASNVSLRQPVKPQSNVHFGMGGGGPHNGIKPSDYLPAVCVFGVPLSLFALIIVSRKGSTVRKLGGKLIETVSTPFKTKPQTNGVSPLSELDRLAYLPHRVQGDTPLTQAPVSYATKVLNFFRNGFSKPPIDAEAAIGLDNRHGASVTVPEPVLNRDTFYNLDGHSSKTIAVPEN